MMALLIGISSSLQFVNATKERFCGTAGVVVASRGLTKLAFVLDSLSGRIVCVSLECAPIMCWVIVVLPLPSHEP